MFDFDMIPPRVWGALSLIVGIAVCVGVILLGNAYGSKPSVCGSPEWPFDHASWRVMFVWWGLTLGTIGGLAMVMGNVVRESRYDVLHPLIWVVGAALLGGWIGWKIIVQAGWTC